MSDRIDRHTENRARTESGKLELELREDEIPSAGLGHLHDSVHLLARWLVSAARKCAPVDDPQNQLDVGSEAKVGSMSGTPEMPVQQAVQKEPRR